MSDSDAIPFGAAIAGDVLSAFQLPGGNTLVKVADAYIAKKRREAANILIEEISNGYHGSISFEAHDVDPLIEITLRFSKAVADGAARANLTFLAQVIAGLKKNRALDADKFRKWCGILEHLTRDELLVIGMSYAVVRRIAAAGTSAKDDFWQQLEPALIKAGYRKDEVGALCSSVSRTGLLAPASGFGAMVYLATPWLDELGTLVDIETATKAERT
jgi:hypothetical protein